MSKSMNAYTGFAKVYETFMDNIPYELWTTYLTGLLAEYGVAKGSLLCELGCGTGTMTRKLAEAGYDMIGIDLSEEMLDTLWQHYAHRNPKLICGSYFDLPLGENVYDAAVSVESLHHFTKEEKIPLYAKLYRSLKPGGFFILTDYFAPSEAEEKLYRQILVDLKREQGLSDEEFYHYDTPLTVQHEREALLAAGFDRVEVLNQWGATHTVKAVRL